MLAIKECANTNQLRQHVRAAWAREYSPKNAVVIKTTDRFETVAALRNFATELGARLIVLDIAGEITAEQAEMLGKRGPRMIVLGGLDTMSDESLRALPDALQGPQHTLPVIVSVNEAIAEADSAEPAML